jgi:hypothetical protein
LADPIGDHFVALGIRNEHVVDHANTGSSVFAKHNPFYSRVAGAQKIRTSLRTYPARLAPKFLHRLR